VTQPVLDVPRGHPARDISDHYVQRLGRNGWTLDDLSALVGDWPTAHVIALGLLVDAAGDVAFLGATPDQARAWLRAFYVIKPGGAVASSPALHAWVVRTYTGRVTPDVVNHWDALDAYADATNRDHDLGLQAFLAGLTAEETRRGVSDGGSAVIGLLAALRAKPS
jgi:hypothetical protein